MRDDYDSQDLADLESALKLLCGFATNDRKGLPTSEFFKAGSPDELYARRALARLLQNGKQVDSSVRRALALLFDPDILDDVGSARTPADNAQEINPIRRLEFKNQSGRNREDMRRLQIVIDMVQLLREHAKVEAAVVAVARKYKIHQRSVWNAWGKHKDSRWVKAAIKAPD